MSSAGDLIMMGLEVDADQEPGEIGTLASCPLLDLISDLGSEHGLVEILASLSSAAIGAADVHEGASQQEGVDYETVCAKLRRFAAHIDAARKEIA